MAHWSILLTLPVFLQSLPAHANDFVPRDRLKAHVEKKTSCLFAIGSRHPMAGFQAPNEFLRSFPKDAMLKGVVCMGEIKTSPGGVDETKGCALFGLDTSDNSISTVRSSSDLSQGYYAINKTCDGGGADLIVKHFTDNDRATLRYTLRGWEILHAENDYYKCLAEHFIKEKRDCSGLKPKGFAEKVKGLFGTKEEQK